MWYICPNKPRKADPMTYHHSHKRSKKATTLVELVVAMALTAIFAGACVMLILPVEKIYTHTTDLSRAQLIADTVVYSLRNECANSYITGKGDVWIGSKGNQCIDSVDSSSDSGPVLVFRKNAEYCETIFSNDVILESAYQEIKEDSTLEDDTVTDRAIFKLFDPKLENTSEIKAGYVHYGYYQSTGGTATEVIPFTYYDFTNPFSAATYREYTTDITFSSIGYIQDEYPSWVLCRIDVKKGDNIVYTRNTILCFAAPVQ